MYNLAIVKYNIIIFSKKIQLVQFIILTKQDVYIIWINFNKHFKLHNMVLKLMKRILKHII